MRRRPLTGVAVVLAAVAGSPWTAPASAQEGDRRTSATAPMQVRVVPPECALEGLDVAEAVRLLRIELVGDRVDQVSIVSEAEGSDQEEGEHLAIIHLRVSPCEADAARIEVVIDDAVTRKRVRRIIDVSGLPEAVRPRALALGAAELLRGSWAELTRMDPTAPGVPLPDEVRRWITAQVRPGEAVPEPVEPPVELGSPAPEVVEPPAREPAAEPPVPPSLLIDAGATLRAFPADGTSLLGGRAGVSFALAPPLPLRVRLEAAYERGRVRVTLGDVAVGLASGAVALDLVSDGSAPFGIELGPRFEVGYGWASGNPADPSDLGLEGNSPVVVLSGHVAITGELAADWRALLDVQLGHTLAGLDATVDGRSTAGLSGSTFALGVGLRVAL